MWLAQCTTTSVHSSATCAQAARTLEANDALKCGLLFPGCIYAASGHAVEAREFILFCKQQLLKPRTLEDYWKLFNEQIHRYNFSSESTFKLLLSNRSMGIGTCLTIYGLLPVNTTNSLQEQTLCSLHWPDDLASLTFHENRYGDVCVRWATTVISARLSQTASTVRRWAVAVVKLAALGNEIFFSLELDGATRNALYTSSELRELIANRAVELKRYNPSCEFVVAACFPSEEQDTRMREYFAHLVASVPNSQ
jgi:hypothetical protein